MKTLKEVLKLTKINLDFYKEKQMRRRIDTIAKRTVVTITKIMQNF